MQSIERLVFNVFKFPSGISYIAARVPLLEYKQPLSHCWNTSKSYPTAGIETTFIPLLEYKQPLSHCCNTNNPYSWETIVKENLNNHIYNNLLIIKYETKDLSLFFYHFYFQNNLDILYIGGP